MATIELYKDKINNMSNYIEQQKSAVNDFCTDLSALKSKILGINSGPFAIVQSIRYPHRLKRRNNRSPDLKRRKKR